MFNKKKKMIDRLKQELKSNANYYDKKISELKFENYSLRTENDRLKEEINTLIKPSKTIKKTPKKTSKQSEMV